MTAQLPVANCHPCFYVQVEGQQAELWQTISEYIRSGSGADALRPRPHRPHCGLPPRPRAPARPRPRAHVRVTCELKSPPAPAPCTLAPHAPEHAPSSPRVSCRCSGGPRDESETAGLRNNRTVARGCWRCVDMFSIAMLAIIVILITYFLHQLCGCVDL